MEDILNEIQQLRESVIALEVQKSMVKGIFDIHWYETQIKDKKNKIAELSNEVE